MNLLQYYGSQQRASWCTVRKFTPVSYLRRLTILIINYLEISGVGKPKTQTPKRLLRLLYSTHCVSPTMQ